jgi:hypothetical protein
MNRASLLRRLANFQFSIFNSAPFLHCFCLTFRPRHSQSPPYQPLPAHRFPNDAILLHISTHGKQSGFHHWQKFGSHFHAPPIPQPQGGRFCPISDFGLRTPGLRPVDAAGPARLCFLLSAFCFAPRQGQLSQIKPN